MCKVRLEKATGQLGKIKESRAIQKLYYLVFYCSHTVPEKKGLKDRRLYFNSQLEDTLHHGTEGMRLGASGFGHNTSQSEISEQTRIKVCWGDGSAIEDTCCSSRRPSFASQHPHISSQTFISSVPEHSTLSPAFVSTRRTYGIHVGKVPPNPNKQINAYRKEVEPGYSLRFPAPNQPLPLI